MSKINFNEREAIYGLLKQGYGVRSIAYNLNRNPSSISRELKRTSGDYSPIAAQSDAALKASNSKKKKKLQDVETEKIVVSKLKQYWSPEQISNHLKINLKILLSHETIYQYIYGLKDIQKKDSLINCLRQRKKKRYSRKRKSKKRGKILNAISIHDRPIEVESRTVVGHWEGDLIIGKDHRTAIGTIVERTTRYTLIVPLISIKDSFTTAKAFAQAFNQLPLILKKTLTYDRGVEMAQHELLTRLTGINVYFADPHSPWQRGTNENTNGLIRNFFPKKTDFSRHRLEEFKQVQELLNERPREILGFLSPKEALAKYVNA